MDTITTIRMLALRMGITDRTGLWTACLLARALGITGVMGQGSGIADITAAAGIEVAGDMDMLAEGTDMKGMDTATLGVGIMREADMLVATASQEAVTMVVAASITAAGSTVEADSMEAEAMVVDTDNLLL